MAERKKVRLRVISRMTDPQGEMYETKNARSGLLSAAAQGVTLEYDDEQDGERAHILLEMIAGRTARENRARMQRKGMTSGLLTFLPGQRVATSYVTMYGDIPIQIDTRSVEIEEDEKGGRLLLDYDVYMGCEKTSSAKLDVTWRV